MLRTRGRYYHAHLYSPAFAGRALDVGPDDWSVLWDRISCAVPAADPPFLTRYVEGELDAFFQLRPGDLDGALALQLSRPRVALVEALAEEAKRLSAPPASKVSLERLAQPQSRVVVTGQQPGLLLGPAYTLSKALSAIKLAARLDREDAPVIPLFWAAGQDHDTGEVDHAYLLDGDEEIRRLVLPLPAEVPSGRMPFPAEWGDSLREQLRALRARPEHAAEIDELIAASVSDARSFADLFGSLLYRLLGQTGLLVLDPTRPQLAALFRDVLRRELMDPLASTRSITEAGQGLRRLGFDPQLGRGKDATNLFIEEDEGGLPRRRLLRFDGRSFHSPTRRYERGELESLLCEQPWRITPAAGLRPVTQDAVLPSAAFVVGPGELRYLAQLRGVYEQHDVEMPLAWPRASSVVLEPPVRRILAGYRLGYQEYARDRGGALERVLLERHGHAQAFERSLLRLESESAELLQSVSGIDVTLRGTVERSRERIERTMTLLRGKTAAALERRDDISRRQFGRLEVQLFPGGVAQERRLSPFSFFLKFGVGPMMRLYLGMGESGEHLLEP